MTDNRQAADEPNPTEERELRQLERDRNRLAEEVVQLQQQLQGAQQEQQQAEAAAEEAQVALERSQHKPEMETILVNSMMGESFPKYRGDPNVDPPFDRFLQDYGLACDAYGLADGEKKARFLSTRLQGHALEVYKNKVIANPDLGSDFTQLTGALTEYFKTLSGGRRAGTTAFYSRKQLPGESVVAYYDELDKLSKLAYPGEEKMPDSQFLERFLRGMSSYLKGKVVSKDPKTSQDALNFACQTEGNRAYMEEDRDIAVASIKTSDDTLSKKMEALSLQVNNLSTKLQENPYSQQRRQDQQPHYEQERWPKVQHHFPRRQPQFSYQQQYQGRGQQRQQNPRSLPNYNREGQPRCFRCNNYGHMMSTCRVKITPNQGYAGVRPRARIRLVRTSHPRAARESDVVYSDPRHGTSATNDIGDSRSTRSTRSIPSSQLTQGEDNSSRPLEPEVRRRSPSGGMRPGYSYLYMSMIICTLLLPGCYSQRPQICNTQVPGQLFALPEPSGCKFTAQPNNTELPVVVNYKIFKYNHVKYDVPGWVCKGVQQTAELFTYFFNDEHLQKFTTDEIHVSTDQCRRMLKTKSSPNGELVELQTGTWSTNNKLNWRQPKGGIPECCKWVKYTATNYYLIPMRIYMQHDQKHFSCSGMDVTSCPSYYNNMCQMGNQALIWEADNMAQCKYLFYKELKGKRLQQSWIADNGLLALTHIDGRIEDDCGITLNISDQGLAFQRVDRLKPGLAGDLRLKRNTGEDGIVTTTQLAAEQQALYERIRIEINYAFQHSLKMTCDNMRNTAITWRTTALSRPIEAVRTLLNDSTLYSRAGNGFLEVWSCLPIQKNALTVQKQRERCTEEIPVNFNFMNKSQKGYLDPVTMVITHYGTPTDCRLVGSLPVHLYGKLYTYNRTAGELFRTGSVSKLTPLSHLPAEDHKALMTPFIFRPVNIYSWEELQPSDHLNAVFHSVTAQAEVLALLGAQFEADGSYDANDAADQLSAGILRKGLLSFIPILKSPFHLWVFLVCATTNIYFLVTVARKYFPRWRNATLRRWKTRRPLSVDKHVMSDVEDHEVSGEEEPLQEVLDRCFETTTGVNHVLTGSDDHDNTIIILATVNGAVGRFLFDSGSAISLMSREMAKRLGVTRSPLTCPTAVSVTGDEIQLDGEVEVELSVGDLNLQQVFRIFDGCEQDGILGYDCIKKWGAIMLDPATKRLKVGARYIPLEHSRTPPLSVKALETQFLPPRSMAIVYSTTSIPIKPGQPLVFEQDLEKGDQFISPRILVTASHRMPIRVVNPANEPIIIYQSQRLGYVEATSKICSTAPASNRTQSNPLADLNLDKSTLNWKQQDELNSLLSKYEHLFASGDADLKGTNVIKHRIEVEDETPVKQKAYRVPASVRGQLNEKLDELLDAGIIEPSCSPWASPLVIVKKASGEIRPCVDLRAVNRVTRSDAYPLPKVDESMEFLTGAKYLSTLDLHSGFLQVPMEEESKQYTAFITEKGLFHYNYMCFGLRNAPATFSRLMQFVLSGLHFQSCILYLDDVLIASKTWEEHLKHIEEVFQRLDHYNLRLKMKKCVFARTSLPFLGFLVSTEGVRPDPENIKKLADYKQPGTVTQTRSFLGFCNYYRRFIKDFSTIAKPLVNLTKKNTKFYWSPECQEAFETLREKVTTSPLLVYPRFDQPFVLHTDASATGAGAVLSQIIDGRDQPIAYFSRKFTPAESRYETVERELYAIVLALKHWKHYLYGYKVDVYSDQKCLSWGIKQCDSPRLMKWIQGLSEFVELKIFYKRGSSNSVADFLSRMEPLPGSKLLYETNSSVSPAVREICLLNLGNGEENYFLQEQKADPILEPVMRYLTTGDPDATRQTIKLADKFEIMHSNGCLIRTDNYGKRQMIVPKHLVGRIIGEMHDSTWGGHLGIAKTCDKIMQKYYWEGLHADVENWIASCEGCLTRKSPTHPIKQQMVPIIACAPWQNVTIDIVGPLPKSSRGNKWILVMQDRFTKWPECVALRTATAPVVARALVTSVITRHGVPLTVSSDRGRQFTSNLFAEVSKLLGMKQKLSCAYRPQTQGLVERWNRTMAEMLRQFVSTNQTDWCQYLDLIMMAYRTSVHSSTGLTPFQLLHGREARLPTHLLSPDMDDQWESELEFVDNLRLRLQRVFDLARNRNEIASAKQKEYHDRQTNPSDLEVGERVYLLRPTIKEGLSPKLQPRYKGPYVIVLILGSNALITSVPSTTGKPTWVHLNHLKRAVPRKIEEYNYAQKRDDAMPPLVPIESDSGPSDAESDDPTPLAADRDTEQIEESHIKVEPTLPERSSADDKLDLQATMMNNDGEVTTDTGEDNEDDDDIPLADLRRHNAVVDDAPDSEENRYYLRKRK